MFFLAQAQELDRKILNLIINLVSNKFLRSPMGERLVFHRTYVASFYN